MIYSISHTAASVTMLFCWGEFESFLQFNSKDLSQFALLKKNTRWSQEELRYNSTNMSAGEFLILRVEDSVS